VAGLADVLRSGPGVYNAMSAPEAGRAYADAPTLLDYANNPSPGGLARVIGLALGVLAEQTDPTRRPPGSEVNLGIMPNLPNPKNLPLTKVMSDGKPTRVFHGTGKTFDQFDPAKADPDALYGPGLYFTENPNIASGYTPARAQSDLAAHLQRRIADGASQQEIQQLERTISKMAPNVRPAYLDITDPFDADINHIAPDAIAIAANKSLSAWGGSNATAETLLSKVRGRTVPVTYEELAQWVGKAQANGVLRQIGHDGITHTGGGNTGNAPHKVWIGFKPEQIVNPFEYETGLRRLMPTSKK
jgi:hypothetical protein